MADSGLEALPALFKLQHYGTPTRICDLTISPLSALFFASNVNEQAQSDGVVYIFKKESGVPYDGVELRAFSKVLTGEKQITDFTDEDKAILIPALQNNIIIQYNYNFSYTNPRAILQGGTGLLFGFSYTNGVISQCSEQGVEDIITEKLMIPASVKIEILKSLTQLGYSESILYNSLENIGDGNGVEFCETSREITSKATITKYIAKNRINSLYFDRDEFLRKVACENARLVMMYGHNTKIRLFFYYDENDIVENNWLCRTECDEAALYKAIWTKDYLQTRMRYMNEQASRGEVIGKFLILLNNLIPIYDEIVDNV